MVEHVAEPADAGIGEVVTTAKPGPVRILELQEMRVGAHTAYGRWIHTAGYPGLPDPAHETLKAAGPTRIGAAPATDRVFWSWSHRRWRTTIVEQVPDEQIIWSSTWAGTRVNGTASFHQLGRRSTLVFLALDWTRPGETAQTAASHQRAMARRVRLALRGLVTDLGSDLY